MRLDEAAFGNRPSDEHTATWRALWEAGRSLAVYDAGQLVAGAGVFSFD